MGTEISADSDTLMRQAPTTVMEYVRELRDAMGPEWADKHPEALASLGQAAALDFGASVIARELGRIARELGRVSAAIEVLADR